jgi:hypothetical protein
LEHDLEKPAHLGSAIGTGFSKRSCSKQSDEIMIRFQSDHNLAGLDLAGLDPAGLAHSEISGAGPRRRIAQGRKTAASGGPKSARESRFIAPSESAFMRLEKPLKIPIYSISYPERLCARRIASFMAQLA